MAVTTVTASLVGNTTQTVINPTDWLTQVRDATNAAEASTLMGDGSDGISLFGIVRKDFGDGNIVGGVIRTFLFFKDINTAVGGETITAATIKVSGSDVGDGTAQDSIIVSASAWGGNGSTTTIATSNYSNLDFSSPYSSTKTGWNGTGQNSYTLTSDAISDMNADGYLNCVVINKPNDFDDVSANVGDFFTSAYTYRPNVGLDPGQIDVAPIELVLTYGAAAATNVSVTQSIEVSSGDLSAGTPVTYSIDNPLSASSYFILETIRNTNGFYDSNSPRNLQGTFTLGTGITDVVSDDYKAGAVVAPGGGNLVFTPTNNVTAATLLLIGTGA